MSTNLPPVGPGTPSSAQRGATPSGMPDLSALAIAVVDEIETGMVVGIGTGRTSAAAIHELADRVRRGRLKVACVATSEASERLARELGLSVVSLNDEPRPDLLFDGADEVDPELNMIKGGGGAMTRERIVAAATLVGGGRCVYIADERKLVTRLGATRRLPVEVLPVALASVRRMLDALGFESVVRMSEGGHAARTDHGNAIVDVALSEEDAGDEDALNQTAGMLDCTPGIVDHGLFLDECQELLVLRSDGTIERSERPADDESDEDDDDR